MERWRIKNGILSILSKYRLGNHLYQLLQKYFGQFTDDIFVRRKIKEINEFITFASNSGISIKDANVLELGTGWVPLAPLLFSLYGVKNVISIDLNSYFIPSLLKKTAKILISEISKILETAPDMTPGILPDRVALLKKHHDNPASLLKALNILLLSPVDARSTSFSDNSFDLYYSIDTLEHIPPDDLKKIFIESRRVLKKTGHCFHSIDAADHFNYADKRITSINFMRYTDEEWNRLCNRYTYHNRLRKNDYKVLLNDTGFTIIDKIETIDADACRALNDGLNLCDKYSKIPYDELCCNQLLYMITSVM